MREGAPCGAITHLLVLATLKEVLSASHVECAHAIEVEHVQRVEGEKDVLDGRQQLRERDARLLDVHANNAEQVP